MKTATATSEIKSRGGGQVPPTQLQTKRRKSIIKDQIPFESRLLIEIIAEFTI